MSIPVKKETHYDVEVFVSEIAEDARKRGCLCLNCKRLDNNIELEIILKRMFEGDKFKVNEELVRLSAKNLFYLHNIKADGDELKLKNGQPCPMALINYATCLTGSLAMAVSRCPLFLPKNEEEG